MDAAAERVERVENAVDGLHRVLQAVLEEKAGGIPKHPKTNRRSAPELNRDDRGETS
jgi:hypothetical protein